MKQGFVKLTWNQAVEEENQVEKEGKVKGRGKKGRGKEEEGKIEERKGN